MQTPYIANKPNPLAKLRLFCFPYAGGGASLYYAWQNLTAGALDVCPLHLPGRERRLRETPPTNLVALAGDLATELRPLLDLPFVLFGYSLGGLISFELIRALRRSGGPLPVLFLPAASRAAQRPSSREPIYHLDDAAFTKALAGRYEGMRQEVLENEELMKMCLPSLRGDVTMLETYEYYDEPPLDVPISAFAGAEDEATRPEDVEGWREQTSGAFRMRTIPGGHFFIKDQQRMLVQAVEYDLAEHLR